MATIGSSNVTALMALPFLRRDHSRGLIGLGRYSVDVRQQYRSQGCKTRWNVVSLGVYASPADGLA